MDFNGMRTALRILTTPEIEADKWAFNAEHDEIFMDGKPIGELNEVEIQELSSAGWRWDEEFESWRCFT